MIIITDIALSVLAFVILFWATWEDMKTREIKPLKIYVMIGVAFLLRFVGVVFMHLDFLYLLYAVINFFAMMLLGIVLYQRTFFHGGDARIMWGLGAVFGTTPSFLNIAFAPLLALIILFMILLTSTMIMLNPTVTKESAPFMPIITLSVVIPFVIGLI